jgi:transcription initiation factor TFIIIB Brf1 subunit/transcription initiation factor TFIIB
MPSEPTKFVTQIAGIVPAGKSREKVIRKANEFLERLKQSDYQAGKAPKGIAAGAVYEAMVLESYRPCKRQLAEYAGLVEVTVKNSGRMVEMVETPEEKAARACLISSKVFRPQTSDQKLLQAPSKPTSARELMPKRAVSLRISTEVEKKAEEIYDSAPANLKGGYKNSHAMAAAAQFIASDDKSLSVLTFAQAYDIRPRKVRKAYGALMALRKRSGRKGEHETEE